MNIPAYENFLIKTVLPELDKGRLGWDRPHTEKVVSYVKHIIDNNKQSQTKTTKEMFVTVAYLHDYGYMFFKEHRVVHQ